MSDDEHGSEDTNGTNDDFNGGNDVDEGGNDSPLFTPSSPQHIFGTFGVDVSVGRVEGLCFVEAFDGFENITRMFENPRFHHVQFDQRRRVIDRFLHQR